MNVLISAGKAAAKKLSHARILLKADQADGGPAWSDEAIACATGAESLFGVVGEIGYS